MKSLIQINFIIDINEPQDIIEKAEQIKTTLENEYIVEEVSNFGKVIDTDFRPKMIILINK